MSKPRLQRSLGVLDATGIALGAIIGAGIFVTISQATAAAGSAFLLALPISAIVVGLSGLSAVELCIRYPKSSEAYEFGRVLISPVAGFIAGWLFILGGITANSTFALAFTGYFNLLLPGVSLKLATIALIAFATTFNYFGIRTSSLVNGLLVTVKVAVLVGFIIIGIPSVSMVNFQPFNPGNFGGLFHAAALMVFAYAGFARPVTLVEEVASPRKTLPQAMFAALFIASALYFAASSVAIGVLGSGTVAQSKEPLSLAAASFAGYTGEVVVSIGALTAIGSVLLTEVLALSRVIFAMARGGDLPAWLAVIHPRYKVPTRAVTLAGLLVILPALYATIGTVIASSSLTFLLYYVLMNICALRLKGKQTYNRFIPIAGLTTALALTFALPFKAVAINATAIIVGIAYYYWVKPLISKKLVNRKE
ncbi:MAG: APC family permease [Candidatus Aquicultor sp.]